MTRPEVRAELAVVPRALFDLVAAATAVVRDGRMGEGAQMVVELVALFLRRRNVPEAVECSVLRTVIRGWCTSRRFQQEIAA